MNTIPEPLDASTEDDPRLLAAAQEYLGELEAGRRPARVEFVGRFPDIAEALGPYLDALDMLHTTTLSPTARPPVDETVPTEPLGDFRIVRQIGHGGMGIVYEAVQMSLGRRVALKVLPFAGALDAKQLQRFKNEAQAAAQLHHPNIVPVHFVGCERGVHYYAMQLIEGQDLADLIRQLRAEKPARVPTGLSKTLSGSQAAADLGFEFGANASNATLGGAAALISTQRATHSGDYHRTVTNLVVQAADALEHAHQLGIIHRDIKPANLMIDGEGKTWVGDFGLAQYHTSAGLTRTGDLIGTLRYMSPEQAEGQASALDPRTDIYSLGATLYELLTLEPLFDADTHPRLLRQILEEEPRQPRVVDRSVPPELETIVLKAVSKSPSDRYRSAREFADDLRNFLDNRPIVARRPTWSQRLRKWGRRHPSIVAAGAVLLVLLAAGSLVSAGLIHAEQAKTEAAYQAERQRAEEAEARFQLARRSVDEMIQVSEELAEKQRSEALRRRLLESALVYYQEFIEQRRNDPAAQADLLATQERVRKILSDLAVLQGAGQLHLLGQAAVLDDLGLGEEQRARVKDLTARMDKQRMDSFRDFGRLTPEQRRQKFLDLARSNETEVRQVLGPEQRRRIQQISRQVQGPGAFREPDVVASLKLTAEQRARIQAIEEEMIFSGPPPRPGTPPDEMRKSFEQKVKAANDRIQALLTPAQAKSWGELTGEPFKGPIAMPPPFGPKGPH